VDDRFGRVLLLLLLLLLLLFSKERWIKSALFEDDRNCFAKRTIPTLPPVVVVELLSNAKNEKKFWVATCWAVFFSFPLLENETVRSPC